jgi:hypothetical protein
MLQAVRRSAVLGFPSAVWSVTHYVVLLLLLVAGIVAFSVALLVRAKRRGSRGRG